VGNDGLTGLFQFPVLLEIRFQRRRLGLKKKEEEG
jgi:hypothetical protein